MKYGLSSLLVVALSGTVALTCLPPVESGDDPDTERDPDQGMGSDEGSTGPAESPAPSGDNPSEPAENPDEPAGGEGMAGGAGGSADPDPGAMGGEGGSDPDPAAMGGEGGGVDPAPPMGGDGGGMGMDPPPAAPPAPQKTKAIAQIKPRTGRASGTVTFEAIDGGVRVTYNISNCKPGRNGTHIHAGQACGNDQVEGQHWDVPRGERIGSGNGEITCDSSGQGRLTYTRRDSDGENLKWTIGDGSKSDIVGHPVMIHNGISNTRQGCGVIELAD